MSEPIYPYLLDQARKTNIEIIGKQNADGITDELTVKTELGEFKVNLQKYLEQVQFSTPALKREAANIIVGGYILVAQTPVGERRFNNTAQDINSDAVDNATIVWIGNTNPYNKRLHSKAETEIAAKNGELGGRFLEDGNGSIDPAYLTIMQQHEAMHLKLLEIKFPDKNTQNTTLSKILTHAEHLNSQQKALLIENIMLTALNSQISEAYIEAVRHPDKTLA